MLKRPRDFSPSPSSLPPSTKPRRPPPIQITATSKSDIWLDELPPEVADQIAVKLSSCRESHSHLSSSILHLALTSEQQRRSIVAALNYTANVSQWHVCEIEEWTSVFPKDIKTLIFEMDMPELTFGAREGMCRLLKANTLTCLKIYDYPTVLKEVEARLNLKELILVINEDGPSNMFVKTLSTLHLEELRLQCIAESEEACPFKRMAGDEDLVKRFGGACFGLSKFGTGCSEHSDSGEGGLRDKVDPFWEIWKWMPKTISEVEVESMPPEELMERLKGMKSVEISNIKRGSWAAERIGKAVTSVCCYNGSGYDGVMTRKDLTRLTNCERIEELELFVETGMEEWVSELVGKLVQLKRLFLGWQCPEEYVKREDGPIKMHPRYYRLLSYYETKVGSVLKVVKRGPRLHVLRLAWLRIGREELWAILRHMGNRLERLSISLGDQDETPAERLEIILWGLFKYNGQVKSLTIAERLPDRVDMDEFRGRIVEREQTRVMGERLRGLLRNLKFKVQGFVANAIESWIRVYMRVQEDDEDMEEGVSDDEED